MRFMRLAVLIAPLALVGCGDTEKTVVVQPPATAAAPSSTVVVPQNTPAPAPSNQTKVCQPGSVC